MRRGPTKAPYGTKAVKQATEADSGHQHGFFVQWDAIRCLTGYAESNDGKKENNPRTKVQMYGKNIDSFDWDDLYKKANDFILENIPVANVNTGSKTLIDGRPRVEISFLGKGNSKYIKMLDEMKCLRKLRGTNGKKGRIINAEIIFNADGSLN